MMSRHLFECHNDSCANFSDSPLGCLPDATAARSAQYAAEASYAALSNFIPLPPSSLPKAFRMIVMGCGTDFSVSCAVFASQVQTTILEHAMHARIMAWHAINMLIVTQCWIVHFGQIPALHQ